MAIKKPLILIFLSLISPFLLFSAPKSIYLKPKPEITAGQIKYSSENEIPLKSSVFWDYTGKTKCEELKNSYFKENSFPFKSKFFDGILWFNIEINKPENFDRQRYILMLGENNVEFAEAFVEKKGKWILLGRTGHGISKSKMSIASSVPIIPLMENLFEEEDTTHLRVRLAPVNGFPINFKIISNTKLYFTTMKNVSRFCLSGGMGICLFFIILLIAVFLKDPAYLFLALSALMYYLRAMQLRGTGPSIFLNFISNIPMAGKLDFFFENFEMVAIAISSHFFLTTGIRKSSFPKHVGFIAELAIIEFILTFTLNSSITLYLCCIIISFLQKSTMFIKAFNELRKKRHSHYNTIFIALSIESFFSALLRILLLLRNFTDITFPDFINIRNLITSTTGYLLLTVPALYSIGKIFNVKYQLIQKEYQNLEGRFIEHDRLKTLIHTVTTPLSQLSTSVLNSACILSKLNFSYTNAEYIELIKRQSSKASDLLVAIRIIEGEEKLDNKPILLLNFFNSCMNTIKRISTENQCTTSLTTAIASDTLINADPRLLQLIFILLPTSILSISKKSSRFSIYLEERNDIFTLTVSNKLSSEYLDTPQKILDSLNEENYYDFLLEISKIYKVTHSIEPIDETCRFSFQFEFEKISHIESTMLVLDKTSFAISDNSMRLFRENKDKVSIETPKPQPKEEQDSVTKNEKIVLSSIKEQNTNNEIKDVFDAYDFSIREKEIATLIIEGNSDKEIAAKLNISPQTVATHNKKIFKKAMVHSRVELINKVR